MSQKKETIVLGLTILITTILVGSGGWWLMNRSGVNLNQKLSNSQKTANIESFAKVPDIPSGLFSYGGSTTSAPIRRDIDPIIQDVWPNFKLRYTAPITDIPGSGTGIKMLLDNQLTFSQSSRSINQEEYQAAKQKGFTLKEIAIAIDGIVLVVNPQLNIPGLTLAQIKDIYTGKITNWNELGGPNQIIIPYTRSIEGSGTSAFFAENVLGNEKFGNNVELVSRTTEALTKVGENLGGIYYASAPEVVTQCSVKPLPVGRKLEEMVAPYQKPLILPDQCPHQTNKINQEVFQNGNYPLTRRLFVIVKENGQIDQLAGESYGKLMLTTQGQELVEKAGFVRIR